MSGASASDGGDEVHQHLRPFEVSKELVSEAEPAMRAFDQTRHVGQHKAAILTEPDDAEVRRSGPPLQV